MKLFRWIKWCICLLMIMVIGTFVWLAFKGYEMYDQALKEASLRRRWKDSQQAELHPVK